MSWHAWFWLLTAVAYMLTALFIRALSSVRRHER